MKNPHDKIELFDFMLESIKEKQRKKRAQYQLFQAFPLWFIELYYQDSFQATISDGPKDGKIDAFFFTRNGNQVCDHIVNSKFTEEFNKLAPVKFYEEIAFFYQTFENAQGRAKYLETYVSPGMRQRYGELYSNYDAGNAELVFVTNLRRNDVQYQQVKDLPVKIFHLEDLIQYLVDDIDAAMPRT